MNDPSDPNSLSDDDVRDLVEDQEGNIWVATYREGLNKFNPETRRFFQYRYDPENENSLSSNSIVVLHLAKDERYGSDILWVGSDDHGLNRLNTKTGKITRYQHDPKDRNSLSYDSIISLYEDASGFLWIGTGNGLNKFNPKLETFTRYQEKDGLPNNTINGILEDDQGNLWISTNKGLSWYDVKNDTFRNFDVSDGLQNNQFNPLGAYVKSQTGELLFGGINGFNMFYPDQIKINDHIPPVVLTDFQIFNQPVPIGDEDSVLQKHINSTKYLNLSYNQSVFSFQFAALNYRSSKKNQYAFKMEGFEKQWNYVNSNRRFATYTNLDPGTYTFRVKASNNDGVWNEVGKSLKITIHPEWWRSHTLGVALFSFVVGSAFLIYRGRVKIMQRQKVELEKLVSERTEELVMAKEIAEKANLAKSDFISKMNHELRTPLNGILGFAQLLQEDKDLSPDQLEGVDIIYQSGNHLLVLINEILDLSKIEANQLKLNPTSVNFPDFLKGVSGIVQIWTKKKNIKFIYAPLGKLPETIKVDVTRLKQILINLLGNSVKFTNTGQITFKVEVTPSNVNFLNIIHFEIEDTGIGIPEGYMNTIFDPFVQVCDQPYQETGTGLGLSICQQLVKLMNSKIYVESELGKGSKFWFELEITSLENEVVKEQTKWKDIVGFSGERKLILIVDDKPGNQQLLLKFLAPLGFEITIAENGEEALEKTIEMKPHLILLDLIMPKMTGSHFAKVVRQHKDVQSIPIIAVSASTLETHRVKSLAAGCNEFLPKPIQFDHLVELLEKHLNLKWMFDSAKD